jgi:hypothetical protein
VYSGRSHGELASRRVCLSSSCACVGDLWKCLGLGCVVKEKTNAKKKGSNWMNALIALTRWPVCPLRADKRTKRSLTRTTTPTIALSRCLRAEQRHHRRRQWQRALQQQPRWRLQRPPPQCSLCLRWAQRAAPIRTAANSGDSPSRALWWRRCVWAEGPEPTANPPAN